MPGSESVTGNPGLSPGVTLPAFAFGLRDQNFAGGMGRESWREREEREKCGGEPILPYGMTAHFECSLLDRTGSINLRVCRGRMALSSLRTGRDVFGRNAGTFD